MEFKAEVIGNKLMVKPIIEHIVNAQGGTDAVIHLPSIAVMETLKAELGVKDGVRDI